MKKTRTARRIVTAITCVLALAVLPGCAKKLKKNDVTIALGPTSPSAKASPNAPKPPKTDAANPEAPKTDASAAKDDAPKTDAKNNAAKPNDKTNASKPAAPAAIPGSDVRQASTPKSGA